MTKFIKEQLQKCTIAKIGKITDDTTKIYIKKLEKLELQESRCYLIELSDYVTNPNTSSTLAINWNNGSVPKYKYWKIDVSKIMAHMVKINGIAFDYQNGIDLDETWSGWVPIDSILVLERI